MFHRNMCCYVSIKKYIVSIEEIYGVLSLSMKFYLCVWSSIFVYGVLSLSTEFYPCMRCMYMETFGCMYAERLGAQYAVVGCMSIERLGACLTVGSFA